MKRIIYFEIVLIVFIVFYSFCFFSNFLICRFSYRLDFRKYSKIRVIFFVRGIFLFYLVKVSFVIVEGYYDFDLLYTLLLI